MQEILQAIFQEIQTPKPRNMALSRVMVALPLLAVLALAAVCPELSRAQLAEGNPRLSSPPTGLNQPFETPVFLAGHAAYGGGFRDQGGDLAYGGSLIFRPGSPVNFFSSFLHWQMGMVIQVDYLEVPDGGHITSGDLIMRKYFGNRGDRKVEVNLFLGLGTGISDIRRPHENDPEGGDHWSILVEAGQEWYFKDTHMFFLKGQYRWMINAGRTWQTWSVLAGVGLAWPG